MRFAVRDFGREWLDLSKGFVVQVCLRGLHHVGYQEKRGLACLSGRREAEWEKRREEENDQRIDETIEWKERGKKINTLS